MADKQSRESIVETKVTNGVNESSIRVTSGGIAITGPKITVDISRTLTGLKALQREAKKATQEIRELENVANGENHEYRVKEHANQSGTGVVIDDTLGKPIAFFNIDVFSTQTLSEELARRDGVRMADFHEGTEFKFERPGRIIIIEK